MKRNKPFEKVFNGVEFDPVKKETIMPAYKVLGDRIKKIRLENNMTQQQFAEISGYTHKTDNHIMQDTFI